MGGGGGGGGGKMSYQNNAKSQGRSLKGKIKLIAE